MRKFKGGLSRTGNWVADGRGKGRKYSVVEIGGNSVKNLFVPNYIDSYFTPGEVETMWVGRMMGQKFVYGIKLSDGQVRKTGIIWSIVLIPFVLFFTGMYGFFALPFSGLDADFNLIPEGLYAMPEYISGFMQLPYGNYVLVAAAILIGLKLLDIVQVLLIR